MNVIPAIDILDGKVVRLKQGDYNQVTTYEGFPVSYYEELGAKSIHLVNLNGAKEQYSTINQGIVEIIKEIKKTTFLEVEIGGGIKDYNTARQYIEIGADKVIIGSMLIDDFSSAIKLLNDYGSKIVFDIAVDENNYVKTHGWQKETSITIEELLTKIFKENHLNEKVDINAIITSISHDGTSKGPNIELYKNIAAFNNYIDTNLHMNIYASGGIALAEDIKALEEIGVDGVIVGKMLYEKDKEYLKALFPKEHHVMLIPKGRLYNEVRTYLIHKGIQLPLAEERKYYYKNFVPGLDIYIAKPKAIPQLMHAGFADKCFCGYDIIQNSEYRDEFILKENLHKNTIRICLCSRLTKDELFALKRPIIVATELTTIASRYFTEEHPHTHYIIDSAGSTEGYPDFCADCIIDVVETGKSLEANNLQIIDTLFESSTCLFEKH